VRLVANCYSHLPLPLHLRKIPQLTIHLSFVGEDDLAAAAGRIDGECFLEALLDVGAPDALGVVGQVVSIAGHVAVVIGESAQLATTRVASVTAAVHRETWLHVDTAVVLAERLPSRAPACQAIHTNRYKTAQQSTIHHI